MKGMEVAGAGRPANSTSVKTSLLCQENSSGLRVGLLQYDNDSVCYAKNFLP